MNRSPAPLDRLVLVLGPLLAAGALACANAGPESPERPDAGGRPECAARADCEARGDSYRGLICSPNGSCTGCSTDGQCELREQCSPETRLCVFKPGWGGDCGLNAQCAAGQLCVQGLCKAESEVALCVGGACLASGQRCNRTNGVCEEDLGCLTDGECAAAELCSLATHTCVLRCTPEDVGEVCGAGQRCVGGRCAQCADSADCPGDLSCDLERLECVADGTARCASNRDCELGSICNSATGFCTVKPPPCLSNEDCLPDQRCEVAAGKCLPRACQPDRHEPNDEAAAARPLATGVHADLTLCDREQDWYAVRLSRGERLDVFVDAPVLLEDAMDTRLLDEAGRVLAQGRLALDRVVAADGLYLLRLQSTDAFVRYGLRLSVSQGTPCDDDRFEPNDSPAGATPLGGQGEHDRLTICGGDSDWFAVEVPADRGLRVELHHQPSDGDLDLELWSGDGRTRLGAGATVEPLEVVTLDAAVVTGRVLVVISSSDPRARAEYFLRIAWQP